MARKVIPVIITWRFLSGNYLDGADREPKTWWTRKTRARRALWRWGLTGVPVAVLAAYAASPEVHVRLVVLLAVMIAQGIIQHRLTRVPGMRRIRDFTEVVITDNRTPKEMDEEISSLTDKEMPGIGEIVEMVRPRSSRRRQA